MLLKIRVLLVVHLPPLRLKVQVVLEVVILVGEWLTLIFQQKISLIPHLCSIRNEDSKATGPLMLPLTL